MTRRHLRRLQLKQYNANAGALSMSKPFLLFSLNADSDPENWSNQASDVHLGLHSVFCTYDWV